MSMNADKHVFCVLVFTFLILSDGVYSLTASSSSPAKIVDGFLSSAFSLLVKWAPSSLKRKPRISLNRRPLVKFEGGYNVETVFDGSKLGIEPHSVAVLPDGDLLILDSTNCNLYKVSASLSLYSRPRLVLGSPDGECGYVDGKLKDSRMSSPKGLAVDNRGNIIIADTNNMAIRKISDTGVTTIAGGKQGRVGGHVDGPSEDAKFSNDFDVVYVGSSCSLLIIDRGSKAIREMQLHFDDCAYDYRTNFPIGIAVLIAAGFFGYMLALLQQRIGAITSPDKYEVKIASLNPYEKPLKLYDEFGKEKPEERYLGSMVRLAGQTMESATEILGAFLPMFKNKNRSHQYQYQAHSKNTNSWPVQESLVIMDDDQPPSVESRTPTPKKTYAFMTNDSEKMQQLRRSRAFYSSWDSEFPKQPITNKPQQQQQHLQCFSSSSQTYYEESPINQKRSSSELCKSKIGKDKLGDQAS